MAMITTCQWYQLSWLHTLTFLALTALFYPNLVSCSKHAIPNYPDHCSSTVPESIPVKRELTTIPFPPNQDGYYVGGDEILNNLQSSHYDSPNKIRKTLLFRTHNVYGTKVDDVFRVEASLILQPSRITTYFSDSSLAVSSWSERGSLSLEIQGFWSKSSGKLCMISSSSTYSGKGKLQSLSALLKLSDVRSSSNISSLVRGTLESLSPTDDLSHFQPISLLMFPLTNYTYTDARKEADYGCTGGVDVAKSSLSLPLSVSICSLFMNLANSFQLEYASISNSAKNHSPFSEDTGFMPQIMSLNAFQCSEVSRSLRFLLEFQNSSSHYTYYGYSPFNPNTTFVAEGLWSATKNQLYAVACRISTPTNSLDTSQVEDCSIRLSLRFPAVLSVRNTSSVLGQIWSNKTSNASGYFDKMRFHNYRSDSIEIPGLKYEYSLVDRANNSCPKKKLSKSDGKKYPYPDRYNLQFDMSIRNSRGRRSRWGNANPFTIGDKIAPRNYWSSSEQENSKNEAELRPTNISYEMSFTSYDVSSKEYEQVLISAEGIYDGHAGVLCMVGCKYFDSSNLTSANDTMDCEILVNVQFPPINSKDLIEGRIVSTREKTSPLYFESITFSSVPFYSHRDSIWRMDLETIMALISNTLVCVFVGYQIYYVKKHPDAYPFISLVMLVVLLLGRMIPLVLNFEALFLSKQNSQFIMFQGGGWLEANEVIVRGAMMVAFLLQFRLLQLLWSARFSDGNKKASWITEKKTLYLCLPLYVVGGLIVLFVYWMKYGLGNDMNSTRFYRHQQSLWVNFRSYAGLVLDGFLFPQILFNILHNSKENALSCFFYMGNTLVRLLPHAYDLYRAHYYSDDFDWSYMYADHGADYYSTAWDVTILLVGLLFAGIIYLQQRNGGRCFLPKRFKELQGYEKVPVVGDL